MFYLPTPGLHWQCEVPVPFFRWTNDLLALGRQYNNIEDEDEDGRAPALRRLKRECSKFATKVEAWKRKDERHGLTRKPTSDNVGLLVLAEMQKMTAAMKSILDTLRFKVAIPAFLWCSLGAMLN